MLAMVGDSSTLCMCVSGMKDVQYPDMPYIEPASASLLLQQLMVQEPAFIPRRCVYDVAVLFWHSAFFPNVCDVPNVQLVKVSCFQ